MIHRGLLALLSAIVVIGGISAAFHFCGIRVNASESLPIGLYRTTSAKSGKLVEFCPPERIQPFPQSVAIAKEGPVQTERSHS